MNYIENKKLPGEYIERILVSCLIGLMAGFSSPGLNMWLMAWIIFVPLFLLIALEKGFLRSAYYAFCFGFCYEIIALSWFVGLHPLSWMGLGDLQSILLVFVILIIICLYRALFYLLFALLAKIFFKLKALRTIFIPLSWIFIMNIVSSLGPFALPWSLIEYSQWQNLNFIQLAGQFGGIGIAFIIILFNTVLTLIILDAFYERFSSSGNNFATRFHVVVAICMVVFIISSEMIGNNTLANKPDGNINACVAQASFPVEMFRTNKITTELEYKIYSKLIKQCPPGIIVLPEGAISTYLKGDEDSAYLELLKKIAQEKNSTLIIGAYDQINNLKTNAVLVIESAYPENKNIPVYNKIHLVPFGEYTPFRGFLPDYLEEIFSLSSTKDFARGKNLIPLNFKSGKIGTLVCYEAIFPSMSEHLVKRGAQLLVNVSNLGWYHSSWIDDQFIAMCIFRALENNRYFVVAINNGKSAIISPRGEILAQTPKNKLAFTSAKIQLLTDDKELFLRK